MLYAKKITEKQLCCADGEADESGEDAEHACQFFPGVRFVQEKQSIGKAYHRPKARQD